MSDRLKGQPLAGGVGFPDAGLPFLFVNVHKSVRSQEVPHSDPGRANRRNGCIAFSEKSRARR